MFVVSFRATRRQILSMAGCALMLVTVLLVALVWPADSAAAPTAAVPGGAEAERVAFLTGLGYAVDAETATVREVLIPDEFDEVFTQYNVLQEAAGMDLSPYHGKRVKCWTYAVHNVESAGDVVANMYVYKDTIVGGDISSTRQDGLCVGLVPLASLPAMTAATTTATAATTATTAAQ